VTNQVTQVKKDNPAGFYLYYVVTLGLVSTILYLFGLAAVNSFLVGHVACIFYAAMFALSLWAFGGHYISIPMTIYLNQKYKQKRYSELEVAHAKALKLVRSLPFRKTWDLPILTSNLALLRLCQGNYENARNLFGEAVTFIAKESMVKDTYSAAILINNLGCAEMRLGNYVQAEVHANRALEILALPKNKQYRLIAALPYALIGAVHAKLEEYDTSLEHFDEAAKIYQNEKPPAGTITTSFMQGRTQMLLWTAYVHAKLGEMDESENDCDLAFSLIQQDSTAINTLTIEILYSLANEYMNAKHYERAERLLGLAYSQCVESPFHPDAKLVLNYYEKLLLLTDRQSEVADMRAWLRPIDSPIYLLTKA
jgi:tetratricopeptide (TPR) repeat protein